MSLEVRPYGWSTMVMAAQSWAVTWEAEMPHQRWPDWYACKGIDGLARDEQRASTKHMAARMGHQVSEPDFPKPMISPLTPFF